MELKNSGFIAKPILPEHYVFGGDYMPYVIHREDGNWFASRPGKEYQRLNGCETFNCTGFNTLAQIECYMKEVFGIIVNYSDRWLGIVAGTTPPGNDPQNVYEAIRKYGLIPEEMLPFSSDITTVEEYYSFKGADEVACYRAGREWLAKYEFLHEWVVTEGQTKEEKLHNINVALKSSPLSLAVYAWHEDERGVYVKMGPENHWTFLWGQEMYGKVEDSYDPTLKDIDQDINYCKRIYIAERKQVEQPVDKPSWWSVIIGWLKKLFRLS